MTSTQDFDGKIDIGIRTSNIEDAEAIFEKHNFDGIPVVDKDQRLMGIVTQRDLLKLVGQPGRLFSISSKR